MFKVKSILAVLLFSISAFSLTLTSSRGPSSKTATPFSNLNLNWYLVEKCPLSLGAFTAQEAYWGFTAKKVVTSNSYGSVDIIDSFNISGYYLYNGEIKYFAWTTGELQNDLDSIKTYLNAKWMNVQGGGSISGSKVSLDKQDSISTYIKIFKSDCIYVVVSLPNKSTIKIYKNNKSNWDLISTLNSNSSLINNIKTQNNSAYLLASNNLYRITSGTFDIIATNVLGYSLDNQGIWLSNSSGELSYLKNGNKTLVKTGSQYAKTVFLVNPIDTTFFSYGKISNSQYNDQDFNTYESNSSTKPMNWRNGEFAIDKNNDVWNFAYGMKIERETNYLKATAFSNFYIYSLNRIFDPSVDPEKATFLIADAIYTVRYDDKPYFNNNSFANSLGYIDEQTKKIVYLDTIHAFDNSTNERLYFSTIQDPIGISLIDSIFTINKSISTGAYTIKFQVRDNFSTPAFDTLSYTVNIFSRKIVVNKAVATTATEDISYSQVITTSDVDNDSSYISYSKLPTWLSITRITKNQFTISGTPVNSTADTTIRVILTDNSHYFDAISNQYVNPSYDTLNYNLTISKVNEAPIITSSPSTSINFNNLYFYQVVAIDDEHDPLTYSLTQKPSSMSISSTGYISWTPTSSNVGVNNVTVRVSDPSGLFTTQSFSITVSNNNQPPVFTNAPDSTVFVADEYNQYLYVSDENTSGLTFSKEAGPSGLLLSSNTISNGENFIKVGWLFWNTMSPSDVGTYTIRIRVTDEFGLFSTKQFSLKVNYDGRKRVTIYPLNPDTNACIGTQYSQNFNATSANQNFFTIKLESGPSWLTYTKSSSSQNPTANLKGTPVSTGRYFVKLSAYDWIVSDTLSYYINVTATNSAPNITSTPVTTASEDIQYSYQVVASDPNGDAIIYSLDSKPQNMSISSTGLISWTPLQSNVGSHSIVVKVSDNKVSTTQSYILVVNAVNDKPVITSTPPTIAYKGLTYSYQVEAYDVDNDVLYYLINAPSGMTINSTGNVIWVPNSSQIGNHNVSIQVSDGQEVATQNYTVTVNDVTNNPVITSSPVVTANEGQQYAYQVQAIEPNNDPMTYSVLGPSGMGISSTGKITWDNPVIGTYDITIKTVDDNIGLTEQKYSLKVNNVEPIIVTSFKDMTINEDDSLILTVEVQHPNPTIIKWYRDTTNIAIGTVCNVFTNYYSAGTYTIKVVVTDNLVSVEKKFTLTVIDVNRSPVIQIKGDSVITLFRMNQVVKFNLRALDPDGDNLTYTIDTTGFDMSSLLVEIRDSNYMITPKKIISDTLTLIVSDGKTQTKYTLIVIVGGGVSTVVLPINRVYTNFLRTTNKEVQFGVAKCNSVRFILYTMNGRMIDILNTIKTPGNYSIRLDGIVSGNYVYKFSIGNEFSKMNKIQVVK